MKHLIYGLFITSCFSVSPLLANSLTIEVAGVTDAEGEIRIALFDKADGFPDEASLFRGDTALASLADASGKIIFHFTALVPGIYAIAAYHDKNGNQQLDKNFFGLPKEPYGISNNIRARFGPPTFEKALFEITRMDKVVELTLD
ncbi:MAG: DUF2141 domain-containing protein [Gammaproteobacteria bacterium]|nr:DUF2141 domain-containing protein [Gammaproteobacteria bacterium]